MIHLLVTALLLFCVQTAEAFSTFTITHLGSEADNTSFLQYVENSGSVHNIITNKLKVGRSVDFTPVTEGAFRISVVGAGTVFGLDSLNVRQTGNIFNVDDASPVDADYNDFVFSMIENYTGEPRTTTPTPEPGTLLLMSSGLVGLWFWRKKGR